MKITKRIITLLLTLALILAVPLTVFAETTIIFDTNGGSKQYGPGSELVIIGVVQNSGIALANTDVTVSVSTVSQEIHYANVRTDDRGVFRTWFSIPTGSGVIGPLTVRFTAAGYTRTDTTYSITNATAGPTLNGFVESEGYQNISSPTTIPASTRRFGLIFSNNVSAFMNNNPSTDESRAVRDVVGSYYGAIERNRDCFTLYKRGSDGSFTRIGASVQLGGTFNTADITWLGNPSPNTGSDNAVFVTPSEGIQQGTTYRLDISGRLAANNSRLMGTDVSVYFTTDGTSPGTQQPSTGGGGGSGGGGGMSGDTSAAVEAEVEVDGSTTVIEYEDYAIEAAIEFALENGADTLELTVSGEAVSEVTEFVFNLSESQIELIRSSVEFLVFNTLEGIVELPRSVLEDLAGDVTMTIAKSADKENAITIRLTDRNGAVTNLAGAARFMFPVSASAGAGSVVAHNGTVMKNAVVEDGFARGVTMSFSEFAVIENPVAFGDMASHWGRGSVEFLASRNIVGGIGEGLFAPDRNVTRAEFLRMLTRSIDWLSVGTSETDAFSDVEQGMWYSGGIAWAEQAGVVRGYPDGTFGVNRYITRQEMAVIVDRFAGVMGITLAAEGEDALFADHDKIAGFASDSVYAMRRSGIIGGKGNNIFDPKGNTTRAESARVIEGFIRLVVAPRV